MFDFEGAREEVEEEREERYAGTAVSARPLGPVDVYEGPWRSLRL